MPSLKFVPAERPEPIRAVAFPVTIDGRPHLSTVRVWAEGDSARCRLCPVCSAASDVCCLTSTVPSSSAARGPGPFLSE
jgi:hypothetical protein